MTHSIIRRQRSKMGGEHIAVVSAGFASEDDAWGFVRRHRLAMVEVVADSDPARIERERGLPAEDGE